MKTFRPLEKRPPGHRLRVTGRKGKVTFVDGTPPEGAQRIAKITGMSLADAGDMVRSVIAAVRRGR